MEGQDDKKEKTDVHYRSMDGQGMFNWRMVFPFQYMPEERVMVVEKKVTFKYSQFDSPLGEVIIVFAALTRKLF